MNRNAIVAWLFVPQIACALLAVGTVLIALLGARYWSAEDTIIKSVLPVMGNMLALPQIVLLFAMVSIFLYNSYQIMLIPVWWFAIIMLAGSGIILGIFFARAFRKSHRLYGRRHRE